MKKPSPAATGAHPGATVVFSPRQVDALARAIAARERLGAQDLPRCRREIRLQLRYAGTDGLTPDDSAGLLLSFPTPRRGRAGHSAPDPQARAAAHRVHASAVDVA